MKSRFVKISLIAVAFCAALTAFQCKAPWDLKPHHDSLVDPPPPPRIIKPYLDTTFYVAVDPFEVEFDWTKPDDAESYELEVGRDSLFADNPTTYTYGGPPAKIKFMRGKIFFRIRAGSSHWNFLTDWTPTRWFIIKIVGLE